MGNSLQDQLLNAGLVDKKKAKSVQKQKKKQRNEQRRSKDDHTTEAQQAVQQARQSKQEQDRQLNAERKAEADKKAIAAQIVQLVKMNKIDRRGGELDYNFSDGKTIKKILVNQAISDQISRGLLSIVRLAEAYEVVPRPVADKIRERDETTVVIYNQKIDATGTDKDDEDYYAQFEIPDDLMW